MGRPRWHGVADLRVAVRHGPVGARRAPLHGRHRRRGKSDAESSSEEEEEEEEE